MMLNNSGLMMLPCGGAVVQPVHVGHCRSNPDPYPSIAKEIRYPLVHSAPDAEIPQLLQKPLPPHHVERLGEVQEDRQGVLSVVEGLVDAILQSDDVVNGASLLAKPALELVE